MTVDMEKIVSLCKRRGFIFQSSEIYGGLASAWDYGPLGVELKRNIKNAWWQSVVYERDDIDGLDAAILMHTDTWIASGHLSNFIDPLMDCKNCKKRFRADDVEGMKLLVKPSCNGKDKQVSCWERVAEVKCPNCGGELTQPRPFNLMFKTFMGPVEESSAVVYLRPETAQGIFVNFSNVLTTSRKKLPFGIAQIGKSFRNEITPGNFTFRSREFEQMEIEYFVKPGEDEKYYRDWVQERLNWYIRLGIKKENLKTREHGKGELAHYAKACTDIEYNFPMGWSELEGIANRGDFDLKEHSKKSGKDLSYFDEETKSKVVPYIIEPSGGVDRATLAFLIDAYREEIVKDEKRVVLGLHRALAPIKVSVLPLLRNREEIVRLAKDIAGQLRKHLHCAYDDTAGIGRLYRRQDEIGTPFCVTVDVESLKDNAVTVRDRDSMLQERIPIVNLKSNLLEKFG